MFLVFKSMAKASEFLISDQHCTQMNLNYNTSCIIFMFLLTRKKTEFHSRVASNRNELSIFSNAFSWCKFSNVLDSNPISLTWESKGISIFEKKCNNNVTFNRI